MRLKFFIFFLIFFAQISSITARDTLLIGYKESPPFVECIDGQVFGPGIWLWERTAEREQIPYKYVRRPLDSLLIGLETGSLDLVVSPLSINAKRAENIDFSFPYYVSYSSFVVKQKSSWGKAKSFIAAFFSLNFFKVLLALSVVILLFGLLEWFFERKANQQEFGGGIKGIWQGFWWSAVTMTTVGYGDKSPKTVGGRIVALIWMFTAIIIISGFTASITSSLTVNTIGSDHSSLDNLKKEKIGTIDNSSTELWLKDNRFQHLKTFDQIDLMLQSVQEEHVEAIAYDFPILKDQLNEGKYPNLVTLNFHLGKQFYAFGMGRHLGDSLKRRISNTSLDISESPEWKLLLTRENLD
ncbi:MAG: transporter substrate-binding domain-containing protein [Bacteroidetes bacterium]|nr:MAG: transporter substrate-binding domain-containing protein [Bacteroidota bacterium]